MTYQLQTMLPMAMNAQHLKPKILQVYDFYDNQLLDLLKPDIRPGTGYQTGYPAGCWIPKNEYLVQPYRQLTT